MDQFDPYAAQGHFQQQTCSDWLLNCLNHVKCDVIKLKDVRFLLLLPLAAVDVCRFPKSLQRLYQWEWHKEEHHFLFLYWSVQHLEHYRSKHCCRNRPSGLQAVTLAQSSDPSSSCKLNLTSHCISLLPLRKHSGPVLPVPAPFSIYKCGQNFISLNAALFFPPQDVHLHHRLQNMITAPVLQKLEHCRYQTKDDINILQRAGTVKAVITSSNQLSLPRPEGPMQVEALKHHDSWVDPTNAPTLNTRRSWPASPSGTPPSAPCGEPQYSCRARRLSAVAPR